MQNGHTHIHILTQPERRKKRPKILKILQNTHLHLPHGISSKYTKTHKHTFYGGIYVCKRLTTSRKLLCKGINHFRVENAMKIQGKLLKIYLYNS